jgi:hypothetical protein
MTIFYCLRFERPQTWRARSPYLYPPGTGWPSYTPKHWVSLSSPPTTRRATVEVVDLVSTRDWTDWLLFQFFTYSLCTDPQRKLLLAIPLLLHDVAIRADRIENTVPNRTSICYVVWRDMFYCCVTLSCTII